VRRLVEFPLQDGGSVVVEIDDDAAGGASAGAGGVLTRGLSDRRVVEQAQQSFEQAVGRVQPAVQVMLARLRALADAPDEVQVEFGVQLSAQAGAFVAAASSTGNFRVSMTWRSQPDQSARDEGSARG
jgi:Trypsin-co-occurring domain 1